MIYEGQIVGIHSKDNDLTVNALKGKQLTNFRAAGKDDAIEGLVPFDQATRSSRRSSSSTMTSWSRSRRSADPPAQEGTATRSDRKKRVARRPESTRATAIDDVTPTAPGRPATDGRTGSDAADLAALATTASATRAAHHCLAWKPARRPAGR